MSKTLLFESKSVQKELRKLRKDVDAQRSNLLGYQPFSLVPSHAKGSPNEYYYLKQKGIKGRKYLRKESAGIVKNIQAFKFLSELLKVLDRDIQLLENLNNDFITPDFSEINNMLPKVYRSEKCPVILSASYSPAEWKRQMEAEKARYAPYRPEDLIHQAQDGTMMRSKSEVSIANYLLSLGITFVYEMPLIHHGKKIWPDFTILSPIDNKTIIIIEHQGAMDSEGYQVKYIRTLLFYLNTKMVPNKDVFFTFNHLDGHLDLRQIDYILHIAFGFDSGTRYGSPVS